MIWIVLLIWMNILWGGSNSVVKMGLNSLDPLALVFWRFLTALAILIVWIAVKRYPIKIEPRCILRIVCSGFLLASSNLLWVTGISMSHATDASLLFVFEPVFGIFLAGIILKEKIRMTTIAGLMLVILGFVILSNFSVGALGQVAVGNLLLVTNFVVEALYSVVLKPIARKVPAPVIVAGNLIVVVALTSIPMAIRDNFPVPSDRDAIFAIAYLAPVCTVVGYTLWVAVMKHVEVGMMFFTLFMQPISGTLIAAIFIGEALSARLIGGALPLLIGMLIAVMGHLRGERRDRAMLDEALPVVGGA